MEERTDADADTLSPSDAPTAVAAPPRSAAGRHDNEQSDGRHGQLQWPMQCTSMLHVGVCVCNCSRAYFHVTAAALLCLCCALLRSPPLVGWRRFAAPAAGRWWMDGFRLDSLANCCTLYLDAIRWCHLLLSIAATRSAHSPLVLHSAPSARCDRSVRPSAGIGCASSLGQGHQAHCCSQHG